MPERDFTKEAFQEAELESEQQQAYKTWIAGRIEAIHRRVSAHEVLRRNGVGLKYGGRVEQFSCPFHGQDNKPSARVYGETERSPSHVWCFVCQKRWDAIGLWQKFTGFEGRFSSLLRDIEQTYGIEIPESPQQYQSEHKVQDTTAMDEVLKLLDICDSRMTKSRPAFEMTGYYKLSVALDRVRYQLDERRIKPVEAKAILHTILEKISAKVRACPED
jgi:DNA primase